MRRRLTGGTITWAIQGALLLGFGAITFVACDAGAPTYPAEQGLPGVDPTETDTASDDTETATDTSGGLPLFEPVVDSSPVVLALKAPPPLTGGTMLLASDGATMVAADPDRDTVWWTSNGASPKVQSLVLQAGDEPGRVVQDAAGLVHVALRRGGAVVTLDLATGLLVRRTAVCPAPRGLAYDTKQDAVVVACVGGELVTLSATDDTVLRSVQLDTDLRDPVVLADGYLAVSKLRNAEVLLVDPTGAVASRTRPVFDVTVDASSAWRMVGVEGGTSVTLTHELATTEAVNVAVPSGYSGSGGGLGGGPTVTFTGLTGSLTGIVTSVVTTLAFDLVHPTASATIVSAQTLPGALPIDVAIDGTGAYAAAVEYGSAQVSLPGGNTRVSSDPSLGGVTSIAVDAAGVMYAFAREPAGFFVISPASIIQASIPVATTSVADTGHDLFHRAPQSGTSVLACASCHPEGRDDGRVWNLAPDGLRRTPSLVGGLSATAPFHWTGALVDMDAVMSEVFTKRMGGDFEDAPHVAAVERFLNAVPRVPASPVPASAAASYARGQALFEGSTLGCTGCHSGDHLTNNTTVNVGTGAAFQVPTLIGVGLRAPFLHDGCATTLADRFGVCGGGSQHGNTAQLGPSDIADLVTYLQTL